MWIAGLQHRQLQYSKTSTMGCTDGPISAAWKDKRSLKLLLYFLFKRATNKFGLPLFLTTTIQTNENRQVFLILHQRK